MVKKGNAFPPLKPTVSFPDFNKLDLRIGQVVMAERVVKSDRLIRMEIDFGSIGVKTIFAGIASWYSAEELLGNKFIFVANLEPKPMVGGESQGMMLAADEGLKAVLLPVDSSLPNGIVVR